MRGRASPLDGLAYGWRAFDFARFRDDPLDEVVAKAVQRAVSAGSGDSIVRTADHAYTVRAWSQRQALDSLRRKSLPIAIGALQGAALVDPTVIDYRDFSPDFALFAVRELGGDVVAESAGPAVTLLRRRQTR